MICEIICKKGEKGSGGTREAFRPGVKYVCSKATRVELRNLASKDWRDASEEMLLTSELSMRVRKPYYHLVLSWHEHERPTSDQMVEAMDKLLLALGLEEHQIVIGVHEDTGRQHIHAVVNTVDPTTGIVWSKSQDMQKAELACRQIEIDQGWSHDRGRFDFQVDVEGGQQIVRLEPVPGAWEKKKQDRAAGRKPSPGDFAFQKHHGFVSFNQDIPTALKSRFAQAVSSATDWNTLHGALAPLGLRYRKHGSGARIYLAGSDEFTKASAFGQAYSIIKLQKKFGPYENAESVPDNERELVRKETASITGTVPADDRRATASSSFKLTLLRRVYTGLHLEDEVSKQIRYVNLDGKPPRITFRDDSTVEDHGGRITTSTVTETTIKASVAMAKAKGWRTVVPSGSPEYVRGIAIEAARSGLAVSGVPEDIQTLADEILEQERKKARRLVQEADAALMNHLSASADREDAIADNMSHAAAVAADAIFGEDRQKSAEGEPRGLGRPPVQNPQPAPDADQHDWTGKRHIERQLRDNDVDELEDMKRVDIGVIAAMGGWSDVSRTHPDSSDPHGKSYRIYTRGADTAKCSRTDGKWLWASNKSGRSGSVVDLWLHDNSGKTLGHARAAFRELGGSAMFAPVTAIAHRTAKHHDHTEARRRWLEAPHIDPSVRTYAEDRGISRATLARFGNAVRAGVYGGIYFAHRDIDTGDIQGFEQRWKRNGQKNAARFAKGGRKTVNVLGDPDTAIRMAVLESGLDALALAELEMRSDTIYISTGGGFGPATEAALQRLAEGKEVVSAFDNDAAGDAMHRQMLAVLPGTERHAPPLRADGSGADCKDWLDVLNAGKMIRPAKSKQDEPNGSGAQDLHPSPEYPEEEILSNDI